MPTPPTTAARTGIVPRVLSIAGSDPSGGAGIQADLKVFSAFGCYGMTVVTALTAQSPRAVTAVHLPPASFVRAQLETLFADVEVDAVKIGMVASAEIAREVAAFLRARRDGGLRAPIVLDPVMRSKGGDALVDAEAVAVIRDELLPLADLVTPNIHEAAALLGEPPVRGALELGAAARRVRALGAGAALVKGGALAASGAESTATDALATAAGLRLLESPRLATRALHGTGCTLSAAATASLALGRELVAAVEAAKLYTTWSIIHARALAVGSERGPVHHLHAIEPWTA
ncbi:MAG: hypothetical protein RI967_247 [Planctomycetota bacterium]